MSLGTECKECGHDQVRWEFSKRLTLFFMVVFAVHMTSLIASAMFEMGDYRLIKDSFSGSLPFYGVIFTGYTAKAAFENYDKFTKQYKVTMKQMETDEVNETDMINQYNRSSLG